MDPQILSTQKWLNSTYASATGWVTVVEDGLTGWDSIYGLRRALQVELGISPISSGFGAATTSAFESKIGRIDAEASVSENLLLILSGSLWCKGYYGIFSGAPISFESLVVPIVNARSDLGLGALNPSVDVKFMKSLLSMDAYKIPFFGDGSPQIREVQQWMNSKYSQRRDFVLVPCDGIFSRQVQTALLFALQYEFGMVDGVANGNFGPGTRDGLRAKAAVFLGTTDGSHNFVRLYQGTMRFNRYTVPFTGSFESTTASPTSDFQDFMEIPVTGSGDYTTWCNLLVSSGDTTIATSGFDTDQQLTLAQAQGAKAKGYTHVGRYTVGAGKFLTSGEIDILRTSGLRLIPLHQRFNNSVGTMTYAAGRVQGKEALERCRTLGLPDQSLVFFSVDFDPVGEIINGPVVDFFKGVNDVMGSNLGISYQVGVYGTRNVCQVLLDKGKAKGAYVAGMSTGFSGNMGFPMPSQWHYNQITEVQESLGGTSIGVDHVVVSSKASAVDLSSVVSPPIELESPSASATGFDIVFEWIVRAEIACEISIKEANNPLDPITSWRIAIPEFILDWLRKPEYWEKPPLLWKVFTPDVDVNTQKTAARVAAAMGLEELSPTKPSSGRDIPHWAVATLGHLTWGVATTQNDYGLGELGGWPLDLLSVWGVYEALSPRPDLATWATTYIGSEGSFDYEDVVADADAWLVAKELKTPGITQLSDAMRPLFKLTAKQRIKKFYTERFGASESNVQAAFQKLADGIDVGPITNFPWTEPRLMQAADSTTLPSPSESSALGLAYARALVRLGN